MNPLATAASAQQASGIAGVVRDSAGLPMPGVTVEAASPVLIEKVRTAVTDGNGRYQIVDLRPGAYTVTFTLTGFNTVRRDGITLAGSTSDPARFTVRVTPALVSLTLYAFVLKLNTLSLSTIVSTAFVVAAEAPLIAVIWRFTVLFALVTKLSVMAMLNVRLLKSPFGHVKLPLAAV